MYIFVTYVYVSNIYISIYVCIIGFTVAADENALSEQRESTISALENIRNEIEDELIKLKKQKEENVRRRHNYIPLAITLLRQLAAKRKLSELVKSSEERREVNIANRKKNKEQKNDT